MHPSSYAKMKGFVYGFLGERFGEPLRVLDVGSLDVNGTYRDLFTRPGWTYVGLDIERGKNVDLVPMKPYEWIELGDETFDVVVSGQAFEHIEFPWLTIVEATRVLKPGGLLCVIAPAADLEHRYPVDCWRIYPDGMVALAKWAHLTVLKAYTDWQAPTLVERDSVLIARKP